MDSPLNRLIVNGDELDANELADLLEPWVRIDGATGELRGTPNWSALTVSQKITVGLLARKAAVAVGLVEKGDEALSPQDLEKAVGVKGGTLRKAVSLLYQDRLLQKSGSRYFVPGYAIEQAKAALPEA
jgi:hypothetical protein